jgi:hypothetical protein
MSGSKLGDICLYVFSDGYFFASLTNRYATQVGQKGVRISEGPEHCLVITCAWSIKMHWVFLKDSWFFKGETTAFELG